MPPQVVMVKFSVRLSLDSVFVYVIVLGQSVTSEKEASQIHPHSRASLVITFTKQHHLLEYRLKRCFVTIAWLTFFNAELPLLDSTEQLHVLKLHKILQIRSQVIFFHPLKAESFC